MKKDFFKKLIFFIISSCIFVSGCSFSGDDDNKALKAAIVMAANNSSSSEKVLVNLNFDTPRGGTMLPDQELTNLEFKGTRLEGGSFSTTADSKDDLCSKKIWLQTGKWNFTLSGVIDGVPFYDTLEEFELTKEHASLSFKLKPGNGISNGGLYLILNFTGAADSAELKVTDTETNVTVESQTYSSFESVPGNSEKKKIEYSKTFKTQDSDGLAPGTYLITVDFYRAGMKTGDLPLNTWKAYARIKAGLTAATEVDDYDLTDSYTITYHNVDTATLDSSGVAVACFSRKSGTITLPAYINAEGFNVLCWYETENFNISTPGITEFAAKNNLRNLDFYPLWDTDTAYAAAGGSGNGLTEANPASSVEAALSSLKTIHGTAYGSTQNALTVQIDGVVTGNTVIDTDYDEIAESLTLTGKTGNENDSLKGSGSGCVLELRTSKPVTLTKLKITGGSGVNYGGGIYICGNSSVILEDGALIEGNEANKQGGGIYVSRNTGASGRTSLTINAGAKISGNKIKEDETYGNNGGMAIYVYGAKVEMNGGEISQNNGQTINQRGAVRLNEDAVLDLNDGKITDNTVMHIGGNIFCRKSTINMKGGEISEGKAGSSTQNGSGGGLWIENNSSLNMTGGIICNNSVGPNEGSTGGAINIRKDEVKLTISGSAYIPSSGAAFDNDIYIQPLADKSYQAVEIAGALTPPSDYVSAGKKIALTPGGWYRRAVILKPAAEAPSELKIEDYENYFTFTSSGVNYGYETNNTAIIVGPYYVADNGLDAETTSGDDQNPYKTLGYVVNMLTGGYDETIKVKGTLKGTQVIPSEFTTTNCKSLTIIGANGLDAQGNPKDVLTLADDAGSGSVLTINTQVPVTLKNIKITGGKGTPGELNAEFTTGGGIHTGQNATLKLADGVLITGNTVTLSGGGIYLGNNSDLYMYGSSYVGDNQQRLAVHDSSTGIYDYANAAGNGGGIYNNGNVYLGYSGKDTSGNLIAAEWTGGICRNCAGNGGGIDSSTGSTVKMRTGKISYNSAKYSKTGYNPYAQFGGGIYSYDTGAVEIIAGEISHNAAKSGGGIYIKDINTVLKLTGGKMKSNSADENGGAINYANGKIEVSGNVYIPCTGEKQNDVYLAEGKFITIAGNLSLPADAPDNAKNVKITPSAWNRGAQVLGAATAALIADNKGHFATIDEDFTVDQKSGETTKGVLSAPIYVASSSTYDDTRYGNSGYPLYQGPRGTRAKPYCSLETALEAADASSHIIYIDGTFTGKTEISSTTLPNTDMLTLRGYIPEGQTVAKATLNGEFSSFGETNTTLIINGAKKVDIYDLTIKGGKNNSSDYGTQAAPGGGILINGSAEVTLGSGATITENTACYGGGVSVFNGKLTVNDGAVISKNTAEKDNSEGGYGGGIYVGKNGSLLLAGGMIGDSTSLDNGNKAIRGGGIYLAYNDDDVIRVEMTGGSVSHNLKKSGGSTRQAAGAGLYLCGKASISGGVIAHNITEGDCEGGGIYLPYQSVCTISGTVEISDNSANYGGGICSDTNDLTVEGGIFRNNNAEVAGGAILAYRVLYLKGNPVFYKSGDVIEKHKNDIDLYQNTASIRITGPVTTSDEYVAAVTPHDFKRGEKLLSASSENISNMDAALSKFVLTKDNDGWNREKIEPSWDPSMRLYIINSPIYVVGTGHNSFFQDPPASGATGTKNMPYASIFAAEEAMDDSSMDYEVIVDGSITGPQKFSYTDYTSLRAKSVIIKGYKPTDSYAVTATLNGNSTGSALTIDANAVEFPVTIQDLTITGGSATNGGGINITKGTVKLAGGAKITGNTATSNGGGVYVKSGTTLTVSAGTVQSNTAASGGAIYNAGTLNLTGTVSIPKGSGAGYNDIALFYDTSLTTPALKPVTVTSDFSTSSEILLTPTGYKRGKTAVSGATATQAGKFTLSDSEWSVLTDTGYIGKIDAPIYVAQADACTIDEVSYGGGKSPSSGGLGTKAAPYDTIANAVAQCWNGPNDKTTTGSGANAVTVGRVINVVGTLEGSQTIGSGITTSAHASALTIKGVDSNAKFHAKGASSPISIGKPLSIESAVPVALQNLTLMNGYHRTQNGGGIYVKAAGAKLTLGENVHVKNNILAMTSGGSLGGGVYIEGTQANPATLIMKSNAEISNNKANQSSGSLAVTKGGGVYLKYANLCMSGTARIGSNNSTEPSSNSTNYAINGGGVYVDTGSTVWLGYSEPDDSKKSDLTDGYGIRWNCGYKAGGGIYNNGGTVKMASGGVLYNATSNKDSNSTESDLYSGGGIYNGGTLSLTGGTINGNKSDQGGGVYNDGSGAKIYMTGTALIGGSANGDATNATGNFAAREGGGVYNNGGYIYLGYTSSNSDGTPDSESATELTKGIRQNYAYYKQNLLATNSALGGGIYSKAGKIYYNTGNISYNGAGLGAGIYLDCSEASGASLVMTGGTMASNKAVTSGGAVFVMSNGTGSAAATIKSSFSLSGSVTSIASTVTNNNDIYLYYGCSVTVAGSLANGFATRINNQDAKDGDVVLSPQSSSATDVSYVLNNFKKFTHPTRYIQSNGILFSYQSAQNITANASSGTFGVASQADLNYVATKLSSSSNGLSGVTLKLADDVELDSSWSGIGSSSRPFKGNLNGNYKTVNFTNAQAGVFKYAEGSTVSSLKTTGTITTTNSSDSLGAVVGTIKTSGTIKLSANYASVTCSKTGGYANVGGIVGKCDNSSGVNTDIVIDCCKNWGNVSHDIGGYGVGGVVGNALHATIKNCENFGTVTNNGSANGIAGGILGEGYINGGGAYIYNCGNKGDVTATGKAGGIYGGRGSITIKNSWASCNVTSSSDKNGGLSGETGHTIDNCYVRTATNIYPGVTSTTGCTVITGTLSDIRGSLNAQATANSWKEWRTYIGNVTIDSGDTTWNGWWTNPNL